MQKLGILSPKAPFSFWKDVGIIPSSASSSLLGRSVVERISFNAKSTSIAETASLYLMERNHIVLRTVECMTNGSSEALSDEDDELCPVDCVREIKNDDEFFKTLEKAKETKSLVVVDSYRTACGSCKYIEQGFAKLCKGSGVEESGVIFLKHNASVALFDFVIDEYDEQSEVAERLRIKPSQPETKKGLLQPSVNTRLLLLRTYNPTWLCFLTLLLCKILFGS